jgi:hypothetical protein
MNAVAGQGGAAFVTFSGGSVTRSSDGSSGCDGVFYTYSINGTWPVDWGLASIGVPFTVPGGAQLYFYVVWSGWGMTTGQCWNTQMPSNNAPAPNAAASVGAARMNETWTNPYDFPIVVKGNNGFNQTIQPHQSGTFVVQPDTSGNFQWVATAPDYTLNSSGALVPSPGNFATVDSGNDTLSPSNQVMPGSNLGGTNPSSGGVAPGQLLGSTNGATGTDVANAGNAIVGAIAVLNKTVGAIGTVGTGSGTSGGGNNGGGTGTSIFGTVAQVASESGDLTNATSTLAKAMEAQSHAAGYSGDKPGAQGGLQASLGSGPSGDVVAWDIAPGHTVHLGWTPTGVWSGADSIMSACRALILLAAEIGYMAAVGSSINQYVVGIGSVPQADSNNGLENTVPGVAQAKTWGAAGMIVAAVMGFAGLAVGVVNAAMPSLSVGSMFQGYDLGVAGQGIGLLDRYIPVGSLFMLAVLKAGFSFIVAPMYLATVSVIKFAKA